MLFTMRSSIPRFTFGLAVVLVIGGFGVLLFSHGKVQTAKERSEANTPTAAQSASAEQWRDFELGGMICMMIGAGLATVSNLLPRLVKGHHHDQL